MAQDRVWTVGYEKATVRAVIDALCSANIELLADVRALPLSRRPGFSKTALAGSAREAGMAYRHFKALGTPKEGRDAARKGDIASLRRIYMGQLELPEAMAAAAELRAIAKQTRTALLCFCGDAAKCHRSILQAAMLADWDCVHLTVRN